jgi:hypothetical protein
LEIAITINKERQRAKLGAEIATVAGDITWKTRAGHKLRCY